MGSEIHCLNVRKWSVEPVCTSIELKSLSIQWSTTAQNSFFLLIFPTKYTQHQCKECKSSYHVEQQTDTNNFTQSHDTWIHGAIHQRLLGGLRRTRSLFTVCEESRSQDFCNLNVNGAGAQPYLLKIVHTMTECPVAEGARCQWCQLTPLPPPPQKKTEDREISYK